MDAHFASAEFRNNLPMLLGVLGIWNQNFLGADANVILPYDQRLEALPDYLQQLFMESQGKSCTMRGQATVSPTGVAIWGATGSHAQHSFCTMAASGYGACCC